MSNSRYPDVVMPKWKTPELLRGQKAIVTGGSSGIGAAICVALAKSGCDVVVNYSGNQAGAEQTVAKCVAAGAKAFAFRADVSQEDQVIAMFAEAVKQFGTLDILVANSGLQKDSSLDEMTLEQWDRVIGVNLTGQFLCMREAVKQFKRQGIRPEVSCAMGKMLSISSVHDRIPWSGHVNYAASKGGVMLLMQSVAQEVAPYRIRVNAISPGAIRTPINKPAWDNEKSYTDLLKLIPYKRIGEPEDVGEAAVWLCSDNADYVHGATLYVDGGMLLYPGFEDNG